MSYSPASDHTLTVSWRLRTVACNLCGSSEFIELYPSTLPEPAERRLHELCACTSPAYGVCGAIVRCKHCGLMYQNPQPEPADLVAAYGAVVDARYDEEREGRIHTFRRSLAELQSLVPTGRLLDVGSHLGFFVEVALNAGWEAVGVEPSRWAVETARARGLPVRVGTLESLGMEEGSFDAVTLWDVIEHLPDPSRALRTSYGLLRPGGVLALSTMDVGAPIARLLGRRWPWYMQMHLYYFSRRTLSRAVQGAGYELLDIRRHRRVVRLSYLLSRFESRLGRWYGSLTAAIERLGLGNKLVGVDLGDIVTLYARKPQATGLSERGNGLVH